MRMKKAVSGSQPMKARAKTHDERFAGMTFASVYPLYLAKVEKKGRSRAELHRVILWLTGMDERALQKQIEDSYQNLLY